MTTLTDRPNTALLVIDVQNGVVADAHNRDEVVGTIASLVDQARSAGTTVVWVQHSGDQLRQRSAEWEYVPDLPIADAHTTEDLTAYGAPPPEQVIAHTNLYWGYHRAPGRTAGTVLAADVDFG